jgi:hypothetical protein
MTQGPKSLITVDDIQKMTIVPRDKIIEAAELFLSIPELNVLKAYMDKGGMELSAETAARFYELFLNGSDCKDIYRLNAAFPYEAILWSRIKYRWDLTKDEYVYKLQETVREKVMKAQLETTSLMADMLTAANKKNSDKIKKYLQTGDEETLKGALSIESLQSLLRITEGLIKVTGQDRVVKNVTETKNTQNLNVNVNTSSKDDNSDLSPEAAAKILAAIAEDRRKKNENS